MQNTGRNTTLANEDSIKGRETGFTQLVNSFLQTKSAKISQKVENLFSLKDDSALHEALRSRLCK